MARKKLPDNKKKRKTTVSIDKNLMEKFDKFIDENNINRSKYIKKLIKNDMKKRNINIENDF